VLETMLPFFSRHFGNASSKTHSFGWIAAQAIDEAREKVAALINAEAQEIIFTSGSTEAINLALKGVFSVYQSKGRHIITAQTEHKAVLDTCHFLSENGAEITFLPVDREGMIDPDTLKKNIRPDTILVAVMLANNETGTIQDIQKLSSVTHENNSIFFCDTTQASGKMKVDVQEMGIDLCCISAHKMYGPKGAGALYVRRKNPRVSLVPLLHGGGHERGLRSGTLNVPGIVGLGKAAELASEEWWDNAQKMSVLRSKFEWKLTSLDDVFVNGSIRNRLPNTCNISIGGLKADQLISKLPLLAFSTGSACTSAIPEPSHVLKAMGLSEEQAYSSIRISLGKDSTEEEVLKAADEICNQIRKLRY
ncbi:MAG TPA: cysteine desulfurase family protein, partial [Bacteroidia bacterium]|nr:cysteine desulfurase family protein [Bacteroidia bacterium]